MFVPSQDRAETGGGFAHRLGDRVSIASAALGTRANVVRLSSDCPPWSYGSGRLMHDLAGAGLI
ncbi:hypothetical protein ACFOGJ_25065 [Marinibaculum pumilum]|uniref:Uncharacterized protein n=1 Tax=Marinibaculum pumilum TaxID=1766165 RepID=A0ABV7L7G8_9PROT